jgi:hypothetical protein
VDEAVSAKATYVVVGEVLRDRDSVRLLARVHDGTDGRVVSALPIATSPARDPLVAVEQVRSRLAGVLSALLDERLGSAAATTTPPLYEAYVEYLLGLERVQTRNIEALTHFLRAARLDTTFSLALIWAAYAHTRCQGGRSDGTSASCGHLSWDSVMQVLDARRGRLGPLERHTLGFVTGARTRDHRLYYESARAAAQLVPVSFWTAHAFIAARDLGRGREALELMLAVRDIPTFDRVFPAFRTWLATELHQNGRYAEELVEAERRARIGGLLNPLPLALFGQARALAASGRLDSTYRLANALAAHRRGVGGVAALSRELRMHGFPAAADSLARLCSRLQRESADTTLGGWGEAALCAEENGDMLQARRLIEACCLQRLNPRVLWLARLGVWSALADDRVGALAYDAAIDSVSIAQASDTRRFAGAFAAEKLNGHAAIAAALGDGQRAVRLLQQSFDSWGGGRLDFRHEYRDRAYDNIRAYAPFARLVAAILDAG